MAIDVEKISQSAVGVTAARAEIKRRDDHHLPEPSVQELREIADRADALNCYGFDAKQDRNGKWIEQGIGSPGHETSNHFSSILRYQGQAAYEKAVRALWKSNPDRARLIGLPQLERIS